VADAERAASRGVSGERHRPHDAVEARLAGVAGGVTLDEAGLAAWGVALGQCLPHGTVLALHGELGAGKTTLVRAIAEGLGVPAADAVTSPTYALVHEYPTVAGTVVHADLYRLRRPDELDEVGWEELLAAARVTIIEWPACGGDRVPRHAIDLSLAHVPGAPEVRRLTAGASAIAS
jgi:tRNA threonylcarbamoyladenosine biosynthesis protein TsaE